MIYEPTGREGIDHFELAFVTKDGDLRVYGFGYQPRTDDIGDMVGRATQGFYTMVVQKVGEVFEVYDLKTLRRMHRDGPWTIGMPIGSHENLDAAIMSAVLLS